MIFLVPFSTVIVLSIFLNLYSLIKEKHKFVKLSDFHSIR